MRHLTATLAVLFFSSVGFAQVFDLADACRGGEGTLPGTAALGHYPINRNRAFLPQPAMRFVDGIFVPMDQGVTQIDSTGTTYDFSASVGGSGTNGTPANGRALGNLAINDPSNQNGQPDFTGDPSNHSLMACHASVGITFDLDEIRKVYPSFIEFTAYVGGSCGGFINYFVLVDGVLVASGGGLRSNNFDRIQELILPNAKYLTLATGDDNKATINCAHGYFGDPFLGCGWSTFGQAGADSTGHTVAVRTTGCPIVGSTFQVGAEIGAANLAPIYMWVGVSDQTWSGLTLPFELTILGAKDNWLNSSRDVGLPAIGHAGGGGLTPVTIPNNPLLQGVTVFIQGFVHDAAANNLGIVTTNSLRLTAQ